MFVIGTVVYGIPLTYEICEVMREMEEDPNGTWYEDDYGCCGFKTLYSGNSDYTPGYCGVELDEINEGESIDVGTLKLAPTEEQIKEAKGRIEKMHPDLRKLCGEPKVWIVWSTS